MLLKCLLYTTLLFSLLTLNSYSGHMAGLPFDSRSGIKREEASLLVIIKFAFHVTRLLYVERKWQYISQLKVSAIAFFWPRPDQSLSV